MNFFFFLLSTSQLFLWDSNETQCHVECHQNYWKDLENGLCWRQLQEGCVFRRRRGGEGVKTSRNKKRSPVSMY